jgi:hypothetical protein
MVKHRIGNPRNICSDNDIIIIIIIIIIIMILFLETDNKKLSE